MAEIRHEAIDECTVDDRVPWGQGDARRTDARLPLVLSADEKLRVIEENLAPNDTGEEIPLADVEQPILGREGILRPIRGGEIGEEADALGRVRCPVFHYRQRVLHVPMVLNDKSPHVVMRIVFVEIIILPPGRAGRFCRKGDESIGRIGIEPRLEHDLYPTGTLPDDVEDSR